MGDVVWRAIVVERSQTRIFKHAISDKDIMHASKSWCQRIV